MIYQNVINFEREREREREREGEKEREEGWKLAISHGSFLIPTIRLLDLGYTLFRSNALYAGRLPSRMVESTETLIIFDLLSKRNTLTTSELLA